MDENDGCDIQKLHKLNSIIPDPIECILNKSTMKKTFWNVKSGNFLIAVLLLVLVSSCAANEPIDECLTGKTYGFFWGIWHGIIAPISLVISFFDKEVSMFAVNNTGFFYGLGFLFGSGGWGILASKAKKDR